MRVVSRSPAIEDVTRSIRGDLDKVEGRLRRIGRSPNPLVAEINKYLFQARGKRIRPSLLILCAKLCGYRGLEHIFWSALVEIIHTASLVHDDIVDNAGLRRGRASVHAKWGPNVTVLLGDFLYAQSIALALQTKNGRVIDILSEVSARMVEGELIEYSLSGRIEQSEDTYFEIANKKTASLFAAACRIGGVLAGASGNEERRLGEFGRNLGLAFQVVDDILDFTAEEKTLGKPVLSDVREGRVTLPLILAYRLADGRTRGRLARLFRTRTGADDAAKKIRDLVAADGSLDAASARAAAFAEQALAKLSGFPDSAERRILERLTGLILRRMN